MSPALRNAVKRALGTPKKPQKEAPAEDFDPVQLAAQELTEAKDPDARKEALQALYELVNLTPRQSDD